MENQMVIEAEGAVVRNKAVLRYPGMEPTIGVSAVTGHVLLTFVLRVDSKKLPQAAHERELELVVSGTRVQVSTC